MEGGNNIIRNDFISVYISARSRAEAVSNFISPHSPTAVSYQRRHRRGMTIERGGRLYPSFIAPSMSKTWSGDKRTKRSEIYIVYQ